MSGDELGRQCAGFREAISAQLDGESLGMPVAELDGHLAECVPCAAWSSQAAQVTRPARIAPAPPVPDLTAAILAARTEAARGHSTGAPSPAKRRPAMHRALRRADQPHHDRGWYSS